MFGDRTRILRVSVIQKRFCFPLELHLLTSSIIDRFHLRRRFYERLTTDELNLVCEP